ncbi:MAG: nitroreductase family protein, partial [Candidatus Hydrogenedentes bacterium]|nr:nitroreductase family protein [Candidatus Hydrogenedentota bacterium]
MEEEMRSTGVVDAVNEIMAVRAKQADRTGRYGGTDAVLAANVAIALSFMSLSAHSLGLGSCWVGAFSKEEARQIVAVPDTMDVLWLLAVGYPDISPVERPRLSLDKLVRYETWKDE